GCVCVLMFFFQAEDGIRDWSVTGVQTCALPISNGTTSSQPRPAAAVKVAPVHHLAALPKRGVLVSGTSLAGVRLGDTMAAVRSRSEERRVGKEWRSGGAPAREQRKK